MTDPAVLAIQQAIYRAEENIEDGERTSSGRRDVVNKAKLALSKAEAELRQSEARLSEYRTTRESLRKSLVVLTAPTDDEIRRHDA